MSATSPFRRSRITVAALAAAVALGGAACAPQNAKDTKDAQSPRTGERSPAAEAGPFPGLSGPEIANRAVRATKEATSVTLDLAMKTADGQTKAHLAVDKKGRCAGTLSVGAGTAELIKTGDTAYLRFDEAMLKDQSDGSSAEETNAVLATLKGKWVLTDATDPEAEDGLEFCDLDTLLAELETNDNAARRGAETTVGGKKALTLTESDGTATYTLYVATEGDPYLLKVEQSGGEEPGTMSFSEFNKPVPAKKPAAKDIIDLDKLDGGQ